MFGLWTFRWPPKATVPRFVWVAAVLRLRSFAAVTGYGLMMKRQREGAAMSDPVRLEVGIQIMAEACPDQPAGTWDFSERS